tara:strand:- start:574 stop:738 length:165 start_codon:yes stop_codon:yes gene_type:complete
MAKVGSRQFPYTNQGMRQAKVYSKSSGLKQEGGYASKSVSTDKKGKVIIKSYGA